MMSFVDVIHAFSDFIGGTGRSENDIAACEAALGTSLAADYREYLASVGLATFDGREITGICTTERLNVVAVTMHQRSIKEDIPLDLYVVEELGIDGVVVWQAPDGAVFLSAPQNTMQKVGNCLADLYLPQDTSGER